MSKMKSHFQQPLIHGLACACLDEQLRSVLLFDADAATFRAVTDIISEMLTVVTGQKVTRFTLNSSTSEEDIWGHYTFQKQTVDWQSGQLFTDDNNQNSPLKLVLIPDLPRLSLVATRAAVIMLGAEVAHLQRHGQDVDRPISNLFWLAACPSREIGMLTLHLLERFALRLSAQPAANTQSLSLEIKDNCPKQLFTHLQTAAQQWPEIPKAIITQVTDYFEDHHPRRELALARLATAIARLESAKQLTTEHLKTAAQLIGLQPLIDEPHFDEPSGIMPEESLPQNLNLPLPDEAKEEDIAEITVSTPTETEQMAEPIALPAPPASPLSPYPEDTAPIQHADNPLKLPAYRQGTAQARGPIIGSQRTGDLRDIAWVATILAAAKCQKIRGNDHFPGHPLLISHHDLHSHRRIPPAQHLLLLVLDYTC
ncbi:MAG: hypothetical protein VSS75_004935, partial [Candidatus Parabeggiatoa sp.]|nr:hypothetical protein [Candidatus Parabeggiatoa sp.]